MSEVWVHDRFRATLTGYRARYGRWPTEVRLSPVAFDTLRSHHDAAGWAALASRLTLVRLAEPAVRVLLATGGGDRQYDYWVDGAAFGVSSPELEEWLQAGPAFPDGQPGTEHDPAT